MNPKVQSILFAACVLFLVLSLEGCAGLLGSGAHELSAAQIAAMGKDKNANAMCITASGPWGKAITTYVVVDKSVISTGTFGVDENCKVTLSDSRQVIQVPSQVVMQPLQVQSAPPTVIMTIPTSPDSKPPQVYTLPSR